jgi:FtsH-binding integral membrane protein
VGVESESGERHRILTDRYRWMASTLLGIAGGLGVNQISSVGFRVTAIVAGCSAVFGVASFVRRLPAGAALARWGAWVLLAAATLVMAGSAVAPRPWVGWWTLVAAALVAAAVAIQTDPLDALSMPIVPGVDCTA